MKRGSKCVAQTINLSNPRTCVPPKPLQKLVSGDVTESCPTSGSGSTSYWTPRPVAVKVCTRQQLRRSCPPKVCDCPQKAAAKSTAGKFCKAVVFLVKVCVAGGLVYWTNSEGLWGDGAETEDLYYRILATFDPALPNGRNIDDLRLPHLESIKYSIIQCYNRAVFKTMTLIVDVPTRLLKRIQDILSSCGESEGNETARAGQALDDGDED